MSLKESQELKQLKSRLSKLEVELKAAKKEMAEAQRKVAVMESEYKKLEMEIKTSTPQQPTISEHAIVRYFERVLGFDMDNVAKAILTDEASQLVCAFKSGKFPAGTHKVVAKDMTIVTIEN